MTVEWTILTATTVTVDAEPVNLTRRPRGVLILLLAEPGRRVSIDRLAESLWGAEPPPKHRNTIARFIADLRRALGPYGSRIITQDGGYLVEVSDGELDHSCASALLDQARVVDTDAAEALAAIREAMALVGEVPNPWLAELIDDPALARQHSALRLEVLDTYADLMMRTGRSIELVADLEHAVESHPHDEGLWRRLISAFQRSGRTAEALRAGQRLRRELAQIGLEPSADTLRLEDSLISGSAAPDEHAGDTEPAIGAPIGRDADLRAVDAALVEHQLVSIVGAAGVGKSNLAEAISADLTLDGRSVYRVDVRALRDAARLVPAIASAIGVPPALEIADGAALARQLAPVSCVIVLDGCDHLRSSCAEVAVALAAVPGVQILATSRAPLRVAQEYVHRLGPLATVDASLRPSAAAELFAARTGAQVEDLGTAIREVEAICTSLQGHPGAILLAASLSSTMTVERLREQLATAGALATNPTDRVLDLSWDSLSLREQGLLARLSVFRGGCSLAGAQAVCSDEGSAIDGELDHLVERGLLQLAASNRYQLDAAVRDFAADRLSDRRERDIIADRLVDWLFSLTTDWGMVELAMYAAPGEVVKPELENIAEALGFLDDAGRTEELAWLAMRTVGTWLNHGHVAEISRWLGPLEESPSVSATSRSAIASATLEAAMTVGRYDQIIDRGGRCIDLAAGEPHDWVPAVAGFFAMVTLLGPMPMTTEEYLHLAQTTADRSDSRRTNRAIVALRGAQVAHHRRAYDQAVESFREGLDLVHEEGRLLLALEMGETISLYNGGRRDEALASVQRWRSKVDTDEWHYQVDIIRAVVVGGCGRPDDATRDLAAALRHHEPISVWARAGEFQIAFGLLADMRGEPNLAAELLATPVSGSPFLSSMVAEHMAASRDLGPDGYQIVAEELRMRSALGIRPGGAAADAQQLEAWWKTGRIDASEPAGA